MKLVSRYRFKNQKKANPIKNNLYLNNLFPFMKMHLGTISAWCVYIPVAEEAWTLSLNLDPVLTSVLVLVFMLIVIVMMHLTIAYVVPEFKESGPGITNTMFMFATGFSVSLITGIIFMSFNTGKLIYDPGQTFMPHESYTVPLAQNARKYDDAVDIFNQFSYYIDQHDNNMKLSSPQRKKQHLQTHTNAKPGVADSAGIATDTVIVKQDSMTKHADTSRQMPNDTNKPDVPKSAKQTVILYDSLVNNFLFFLENNRNSISQKIINEIKKDTTFLYYKKQLPCLSEEYLCLLKKETRASAMKLAQDLQDEPGPQFIAPIGFNLRFFIYPRLLLMYSLMAFSLGFLLQFFLELIPKKG